MLASCRALNILSLKSQTVVRISRETGSSRVASLGSSLLFLKAFDAVTKEIMIITHEHLFLIVNVVLFVNFPNVTVVHMGFHNKERQPERQNNFSCQSRRRLLIPTKMFVWVTERTLKNIIYRKAVNCLWLVHNIVSTIKKKVFKKQTKEASGASLDYLVLPSLFWFWSSCFSR